MAEANTSSTQQSADAQHVDNMTSMQQSSPEAPSGARSDAPVQTNNVGSQDGPSQLNASPNGNSNANNVQGGSTTNSNINGGSGGINASGTGSNPGSPIGQGAIGSRAGTNGAGLGGFGGLGATAATNDGGNAAAGNGAGGAGAPAGNAGGAGNTGAGGGVGRAGGATAAGNAGAGGTAGTTGSGTTGTSTTGTSSAPTAAAPAGGEAAPPVTAPVTAPPEVVPTTPTTTLNNVTLTGATPLPPVEADTTNTSSGAPSVALNPVLGAPISGAIAELGATTGAPVNVMSTVLPAVGIPTGDVVHFSYFDASTSNTQSIAITLHSVNVSGTSFAAANLATLTTALTPDPTGHGVVTQVFSLDKVTPSIVTTAEGLTGTQTAVDLKFIVPDKTFDPLAAGQTVTATYDVVVTNSVTGLASSIQQVTITITGSNDIPVIGAATTNLGLGLYDTDIAHSYTNPYPDIAGTGALTHANFLADGVISIADPDLGESSFQSGTSSGTGAVVAAAGNIGTLVLAADGSYIYRIDQLPTNTLGQFDPAGSISSSDKWVLTDFQTLFVPGTTHTDTFTITSFDGTTKDVHFTINGDHNIEGSVVEPDPTTPASKTGSLNFAAGTHDAMVLVGNDSNAYFSGIDHLNIGSLSIDNTGAFVYTVTADAIKTYEGDLPGSFNTGRDTFIVESTNGVNVNYQEVSFNIFRADHLATATGADQHLIEGSSAGDNVFLFSTWDSVYNATHNYLHTIDNFNVMNGDRIDLSAILTSSSDTLSDTIFIDGAGGASSSALSVHHGGSDYQVASITGVEATVNDLMWGFNSGADPVTSLNAATTWTDVIDISNISSGVGNPTITAHDGAIVDTKAYTAGAGGWTIDIVSGNATVSTDGHIHFTTPNSQNEVIITDPSSKVHDLSNINQINWHAT